MPHVNIKHFPTTMNEAQRLSLADAIVETILTHFDTYPGAVTVALEPIAESEWEIKVMRDELVNKRDLIIKAAEYRTLGAAK